MWPLSESVSNLCLCFRTCASAVSQQVQSASVHVNSDQQVQVVSHKKKRKQLRVHILNSHKNPALRHNRDFNIVTAQRPREAMQVFIRINEASICRLVLARARFQVLQNSASRMVVLRFTTLSARVSTARSPLTKSKKKNYREGSNIKSARVGALTGSVTCKMAKAWQRVSAPIRDRTHVA